MKKLVIIFCALYICIIGTAASQRSKCLPSKDTIEANPPTTILTISGNAVQIKNAIIGSSMEVYNILGMKVAIYKIDSPNKTITLNLPKGWYILKVDNLRKKMAVK